MAKAKHHYIVLHKFGAFCFCVAIKNSLLVPITHCLVPITAKKSNPIGFLLRALATFDAAKVTLPLSLGSDYG